MPFQSDPAWLHTDDEGRLVLVETEPGSSPFETRWYAAVTGGVRDLATWEGKCVHDGVGDRREQVARSVRAAMANRFDARMVWSRMATRLVSTLDAEPPNGDELRRRLVGACGKASVLAVHVGKPPSGLAYWDDRFGHDAVDAFFDANRCLTGLFLDTLLRTDPPCPPAVADVVGHPGDRAALARALLAVLDDPGVEGLGRAAYADLAASSLSRLGSVSVPSEIAQALFQALPHVPPDWVPSDHAGTAAFLGCVRAARPLRELSGGRLDLREMLAPSRGRWAEYLGRLGTRQLPPLDRGLAVLDLACKARADEVADMATAFERQVLRPTRLHVMRSLGRPLPPDDDELGPKAWDVLFSRKGLPAVFEVVQDWHGRQAGMLAVLRTIHDERRWPKPFEDFAAPNGFRVAALTSAAELTEEGGLLRHCVATYAVDCAAANCVVASVRDADGARTSTVQLSVDTEEFPAGTRWWTPRVRQHKSMGNASPGKNDREAVAALVADIAAKRLPAPQRVVLPPAVPGPAGVDARLARWIADLGDRVHAPAPRPRPGDEGEDDLRGELYDWRDERQVEAAIRTWERFLPRDRRNGIARFVGALDEPLAAAYAQAVAEGLPGRPRTPWRALGYLLSGNHAPPTTEALVARYVIGVGGLVALVVLSRLLRVLL